MLKTSAGRRGCGGSGTAWRPVAVIWLAGVQAAVGLGAVAPVSSAVQSSLGVSLSTVACATSGMTAVGAAFGIPAARWSSRLHARDALVAGLLVIAAAAGLSALSGSWPVLLGSRVLEGAGYLMVLVTGPSVLARLTLGRTRTAALAVWGTCVPVGLAFATAGGGILASELTWNRWLAVTGIGPLLTAGFLAVVLPRLAGSASGRRPPSPGALTRSFAPAGAYACLSLIAVAVTVLLPAFLTQVRHSTSADAGTAAAVVSVCSALGGLCASWLLSHGAAIRTLLPLAVFIPLGCLLAFSSGVPLGAGMSAAALLLFVNGLLISAVFAAVPAVTRRIEEVDVVNGALAQFGSLGILVGPPLFGVAVGLAGWSAVGAATILFTVPAFGLLLLTVRGVASAAPAGRSQAPLSPDSDPGPVTDGQNSRRTE